MHSGSRTSTFALAPWFPIAVIFVAAFVTVDASVIEKSPDSDFVSFPGPDYDGFSNETDNGRVKIERKKRSIPKYTSYDQLCKTDCSMEGGTNYYWCRTSSFTTDKGTYDWDYCSPAYGYDFRGRVCIGSCAKGEQAFKACSLLFGGWGYCS